MDLRHTFLTCLCLTLLALSGCSSTSGRIASFEDLATESQREGLTKLPQYRVISIAGLLPFDEVGDVHFFKPKRKPSTAIALTRTGNSQVIESTIDASCNLSCLIEVRDEILKVKRAAALLIEKRIQLTNLRSKPDTPDNSLSAAEGAYTTARNKLDEAHEAAIKKIKHRGVIVFRWNLTTNKSSSLNLGKLLGAGGQKEQTESGFGILCGLKINTLVLSSDLASQWGNLPKSRYTNRFEVTTQSMQAKHILYMSEQDLSKSLQASLDASYKDLAHLSKTLKALDKIEIKAALSQASNFANVGVISGMERNTYPVNWEQPSIVQDPNSYKTKMDGWQTIYAVKSDIRDLIEVSQLLATPPTN